MIAIPKKVADRLSRQVGPFQKILRDARSRDINEADTVTIVKDMLADVFGFDKYVEVTSEHAIRGTYCDLAATVNGKIQYLIEVKAIGLMLTENHLRQAVSYGANQGVEWVVLTNGINWQIYRITVDKTVSHELLTEFNFFDMSMRKQADRETLFLLCRSGMQTDAISKHHERVQTVNRCVLAALVQSPPVVSTLRRELKRLLPNRRVSLEEVEALLPHVLKRDAIDGQQARAAHSKVKQGLARKLRRTKTASV